jgi:hypothetical protein
MNSGYYQAQVSEPLPVDPRLDWWMDNQAKDLHERRRGRWEIEAAVIQQLETQSCDNVVCAESSASEQANLHSALRRPTSPVKALKDRVIPTARAG